MPNKIVSLRTPGLGNADVNGVSFNAVAITSSDNAGEPTTFVLEVKEAQDLGRKLALAAERVIAEERKSQAKTIREMGEGH